MLSDVSRRLRTPEVVVSFLVAVLVLVAGFVLTAVPQVGVTELRVDRLLLAHVPATGHAIATGIGMVLEPVGGVLIIAVVAAVVWWRADVRRADQFVVTAVVPWLSVELVKLLVHRPRPVLPGVHAAAESWSYPSGHVALITAVVLGILTVTAGRVRVGTLIVGVVAIVLVAVSRLSLGVHYPSDLVASVLWTTAVWVVLRHLVAAVQQEQVRRRDRPTRRHGAAPVERSVPAHVTDERTTDARTR
ncbi:phosphatase PAP2 family protein [Curtobacterium sp. ISL-83]|uniref:phosphatase PAP2 family protein n=1 Tax=Curtobacterium sp. ISL-83 TaxID=2819145 RepID=UPI001BE51B85|nr:phosphatase PAP2 family protein [Curtobacterium sp. ISL-83]MBT2504091.1 phosphatase PAP2 family protein [Curtobacterium sp. ISL-83]